MAPAGKKATQFSSVNHTTKTIHALLHLGLCKILIYMFATIA